MIENENSEKPIKSAFQQKIDDKKYDHDSTLNRDLDRYSVKLIKVVGVVGIILGLLILIAFWVWVIRWLYQIW
ncbi:MAG: hypothetical protein FJX84_00650 [Bacteroidetes bacterium]|nr:hypothetical protein [Bacteroidota bacterium]